jgi:hypothetical protein
MLGFKFTDCAHYFLFDLEQISKPIGKVIIFFHLTRILEEFLKENYKNKHQNHSRGLLPVNKSKMVSSVRKPLMP